MKMEVLSVQNHIQGQFGVIGGTKVKDWTSPLTAPATTGAPAGGQPTTPTEVRAGAGVGIDVDVDVNVDVNLNVNVDVVDGHPTSVLHMRQHQALNTRSLAPAMPTKQATQPMVTANFDAGPAHVNGGSGATTTPYPHHQHPHAYMSNVLASAQMSIPGPEPVSSIPSLPASPLQSTAGARFGAADNLDDVSATSVLKLSNLLQSTLRAAKSRHLACTEVTLPADLTHRIAAEIIRMSEREPCGERASTIFIEFESEPNNARHIASFKVDPDTVSIFELYLTLKQDKSGWTSLLPQFLKNLTRSNTIMISPDFTLTKNKLYSSE
ncbi:protein charybde [Scaptodrosophila lebanonensis]|uniref:Protein charybde n=1 Tax=Drosophila lebanonensis TaxID=7225 RepID=A0A6J2T5I4_DROLE|nr:protein charybde [Scaptodrosophila lebanonensis]